MPLVIQNSLPRSSPQRDSYQAKVGVDSVHTYFGRTNHTAAVHGMTERTSSRKPPFLHVSVYLIARSESDGLTMMTSSALPRPGSGGREVGGGGPPSAVVSGSVHKVSVIVPVLAEGVLLGGFGPKPIGLAALPARMRYQRLMESGGYSATSDVLQVRGWQYTTRYSHGVGPLKAFEIHLDELYAPVCSEVEP
jgi:hypothetical protein